MGGRQYCRFGRGQGLGATCAGQFPGRTGAPPRRDLGTIAPMRDLSENPDRKVNSEPPQRPGGQRRRLAGPSHRLFGGLRWGLLALGLSGCAAAPAEPPPGDDDPQPGPESCPSLALPTDPTRPEAGDRAGARFPDCSDGSGAPGRWTLDAQGLPAYDYLIDQNRDDRARYPTTDEEDHREHFHALGNDRINAVFANDGYVQVFTQDRGATWLNQLEEASQNFAGGFSYVDDGQARWATAYKWRPPGARSRRRFGLNYAEAELTYNGVRVRRRVYAPRGDVPGVLCDVTIENLGAAAKDLRHYEYWDVGRRQLRVEWLASGVLNRTIPERLRAARDALNALWDETPSYSAEQRLVQVRRTPAPGSAGRLPAATEVSPLDAAPGDPYLQAVIGEVAAVYTDQATFFGRGGVSAPDAVRDRAAGQVGASGETKNGAGQPHLLVLRSDLSLQPGEQRLLRFVYGYTPPGKSAPAVDPDWRTPGDLAARTTRAVAGELLHFQAPRTPWLQRELAWHSAQLLGSVGYSEYFGRHVAPQGSAYLYLHGVDGAPRDLLLFVLPLCYLRPQLAREMLQLTLGLVYRADRRMSYAYHGYGVLDDAIIHSAPSDLYLYFLLALNEYLAVTGDTTILDEPSEPYPRGSGPPQTGFAQARLGIRHLLDVIGTGAHGLVRLQTGDWSDGIVLQAKDLDLAIAKGESVPNTQLAAYVLPRAAAWVRARDPALADELVRRGGELQAAAAQQWAGEFYTRAYFGDGVPYGNDRLHLEAQVWPLIAGLPDGGKLPALLAAIEQRVDSPSPIGAFVIENPEDRQAGQTWPAITGLLTWGYARAERARPELAWGSLTRMTMRAHARAFPNMWAGIWSGADGSYGARGGAAAGATWASEVTPMTDFPVFNNNLHAMPLLAALRVAGIEPLADGSGLLITPPLLRSEAEALELDAPLVRVVLHPGRVQGEYRPLQTGTRAIEVELPAAIAAAELGGVAVPVPPGARRVRFELATSAGKPVTFSVTAAP